MKKSLLATIATVSLTFAGLVSGIAPANAVYNVDDSHRDISVQRGGGMAIVGNNIVASTTLNADERLTEFSFSADFASEGSPLVVAADQELEATVVLTNTTSNTLLTGYNNDPHVEWTKTDNTTGTWRTWDNIPLPAGTFKSFKVSGGTYAPASVAANYSANATVTLGGTTLTPVELVANPNFAGTPGFRIAWLGGPSYTPSALDYGYSSYSVACFWPGDHNITADTVLNVSYDNLDQTNNLGFAENNYSYFSGNDGSGGGNAFWNPIELETNEVFSTSLSTLLPGIDAVTIRGNASVNSPTANAIRPVFKAWLDNNTSVNVLDSCTRYESFAAPTLASATSTTATLSWTAPTTAHASDWDDIGVYACLETNANCATGFVNPWDMSPDSTMTYDFELMSMGPITGTQATISANMMMDSAMMMGPSAEPRRLWSTSGSYKYFVVYRDMMSSAGYIGLSAASAAVTAGGVVTPDVDQEEVVTPAAVVAVPTPIKNFAPHKVAALGEKNLTLDGSGLAADASITVNGKKLAFTKDAAGKIQLELPKGLKRGASYNLVVADANGSFTLLDAIVVPQDLPIAKKALPAFKGRATNMNATQVRDIRALVAASHFGDTVTCTAYVGGATTEGIAKARATSACATATAANPALTAVIRTAKAIPSVLNTVRVVIG